MFALRTKKQPTTQFSPYFLLFGREAKYPSEVPQKYEVTTKKVEQMVRTEVYRGLDKQETFKVVHKNVAKKQEAVRKQKMKGEVKGKFATLASLNSPRKTVANIDNLTHFIEPEERIPAKLKKVGTSPLASPSPPPPSSPDPPLGTSPGERQPSQTDLQSLAPGKELESEIVNAYLSSVLTMSSQKCKVIDTFQMTAIWYGTSRRMRKAMYPKEGRAVFIDPFGPTVAKMQKCKASTRAFMREKNGDSCRGGCAAQFPIPASRTLLPVALLFAKGPGTLDLCPDSLETGVSGATDLCPDSLETGGSGALDLCPDSLETGVSGALELCPDSLETGVSGALDLCPDSLETGGSGALDLCPDRLEIAPLYARRRVSTTSSGIRRVQPFVTKLRRGNWCGLP
ncbi:unnamed protein product [Arctogadus glacialis]